MPPAIIAGGIAAAGTIGGAVLSSSAQNKAAKQANQSEQAATQAQLQLGRESMALNKDIYNSNYQTLSPFVSRGNVAGDAINALLGLPQAPAMQSPLATPPAGGTAPQTNPVAGRTPVAGFTPQRQFGGFAGALQQGAIDRNDLARPTVGPQVLGNRNPGLITGGTTGGTPAPAAPPPPPATAGAPASTTPAMTPQTATSALNNFANSAGMQFQLQQGTNALNNMYAAHGLLQSGEAMKGIQGYGQQTALNNYFMPYMGLLGGQQAVGAGAGSSIAGVGQNFGNTAAAINGQMGNAIQGGADAAANAALIRGQNSANMIGSIGSSLGGFASSFFPSGGLGGGSAIGTHFNPTNPGVGY
jgi:hypothetical protein